MQISGIHLPVTCKCSFISKKNILEKGFISPQLLSCPMTMFYHDFENHSHAVPVIIIFGMGKTYDI
jgi:hypothetical protein